MLTYLSALVARSIRTGFESAVGFLDPGLTVNCGESLSSAVELQQMIESSNILYAGHVAASRRVSIWWVRRDLQCTRHGQREASVLINEGSWYYICQRWSSPKPGSGKYKLYSVNSKAHVHSCQGIMLSTVTKLIHFILQPCALIFVSLIFFKAFAANQTIWTL